MSMPASESFVTWDALVGYVGSQLTANTRAVERVAGAMERHEDWHRRHLEDQLRGAARRPWSWAQTLISLLAALAGLAAVVVAVAALPH